MVSLASKINILSYTYVTQVRMVHVYQGVMYLGVRRVELSWVLMSLVVADIDK